MARRYIPRSLEPVLRRAVTEFPAVVLTGPRQSGKTTLLKRLFGEDYAYVSLETPDVQVAAVVPIEVYESWKRQRREFFELIRGMQMEADLGPQEAERIAAEAVRAVRSQAEKAL